MFASINYTTQSELTKMVKNSLNFLIFPQGDSVSKAETVS